MGSNILIKFCWKVMFEYFHNIEEVKSEYLTIYFNFDQSINFSETYFSTVFLVCNSIGKKVRMWNEMNQINDFFKELGKMIYYRLIISRICCENNSKRLFIRIIIIRSWKLCNYVFQKELLALLCLFHVYWIIFMILEWLLPDS